MPTAAVRLSALAALLVALPVLAAAQQRPLVTEDPETIGEGRVLIEAGFDHGRDVVYPASGLTGNLTRLPLIGISIGLSSIAELQIDGGLRNRLSITDRQPAPLTSMLTVDGTSTSDVEDIVIGTKIRVAPETPTRPSFGFRFATRLPNADNETGLGLDTTDFFASILVGKTVRSVRTVANIGIGILGDPLRGDRQNDVITYGLSMARALTNSAEVVAEVNGRQSTSENPAVGTTSRAIARAGARYTYHAWRGDAAVLVGLKDQDPDIGVAVGFTFVFNAFTVPRP
jgi:hypothetical protein